jgi:signal transduction histidine kinase
MDAVKDSQEPGREAQARFLRGLTHELRTPLASMLILAELLADGPDALSPGQRDKIAKIRQAGAGMKELIEQVSTLAKIADGRMSAHPQRIDLHAVVSELHDELGARARGRGLSLELRWEPGLPQTLHTDREILRRVLACLLEHALATARDGEITLSVARGEHASPDTVAVAVSHTGPGIPADQRQAVFEPFPPDRLGRPHQGGALTLPLAKRLSELLLGRLELSDSDGRGSTFTLSLPLEDAP